MSKIRTFVITAAVAALSVGAVGTAGLVLSATEVAAKGKPDGKSNNGKAHEGEKKSAQAAKSQARAKVASELKNLNAMCANENAFANAAEGSNVHNIGEYFVAYADVAAAQLDLDTAAAAIGGAENFSELSVDEINAEIAILEGLIAVDNADGLEPTTDLTEAEIAAAILSWETQRDYAEALAAIEELQIIADDTLLVASRGREISPEALEVLNNGC
jgi:hypothetical protein